MLSQRTLRLVALILGLLLGLVACDQSSPADTPAAPLDTPITPPVTEDDAETPSQTGEEVELTFWMVSDPPLVAAMEGIIQAYTEAHPNVTITQETFPFGEYFQQIVTAFSAGDAPDVYFIDVRTASFADQGLLLPLDEFITDENRADVIDSAWREATWEGATYSIPLHQVTDGLYVNKQMADEAGLEVPTTVDEAWTWEEMVELAQQFTVRDGSQTRVWGFGMERHLDTWPLTAILYQGGGQPLSPDLTQADGYLNSDESVAAMTWIADMVREHEVMPIEPIPDGFPTGQIALFHGTSTYRAALANNFPDFQYGSEYLIAPVYRGPAGCAVTTGGFNVGIASTTEHPDVAWSLVDWMTRERHLEWVTNSGYLPIRMSVMDEPQFQEPPWTIFVEELEECAITRPPIPHYQVYDDLMSAIGVDAAIGGDVQDILDNAAAEIDRQQSGN